MQIERIQEKNRETALANNTSNAQQPNESNADIKIDAKTKR